MDRLEPGAVDELEQPLGARGRRLRLVGKARFHIGERQHIDRVDTRDMSRFQHREDQPTRNHAAAEGHQFVRVAGSLDRNGIFLSGFSWCSRRKGGLNDGAEEPRIPAQFRYRSQVQRPGEP